MFFSDIILFFTYLSLIKCDIFYKYCIFDVPFCHVRSLSCACNAKLLFCSDTVWTNCL